jgi:diguanylate cyclase (GGDEF)-like protein
MFQRIRTLLAAPVFEDDEKTRQARLLIIILRAIFVFVAAASPLTTALASAGDRGWRLIPGLAAIALIVGLFALARLGHTRLASALLCVLGVAFIAAVNYAFGGLRSPVAAGYLVMIAVAGLLLGGRWAIAVAALSMLAAAGTVLGEAQGWISPAVAAAGVRGWIIYTGYFGLMAVILFLAARNLRAGLENARRLRASEAERARALDSLLAQARRRAAQLSLLGEVSRQIAGTLDEQEIFQRTVNALEQRFAFTEASILISVEPDELELVAHAGADDLPVSIGFRQKTDRGVIGHVARTRATHLVNDILTDPYYSNLAGRTSGSALGVPMLREGQLLGVLYVESGAAGAVSAEDVQTLETLAHHVATALQNARLYARAQRRLRELTALQSAAQAIVSSLELKQIFRAVVRLLENIGYRYVSLYLREGEALRLGAQAGYPEDIVFHEIPVASGVSGRAVRTRQPQFVRDVSADPDFLRAAYEVRSEISVPLLKEQTVLGVLNVESGPERTLTEADVDLLTTFAGQVTVAVENARLFEAERAQRELAEALREVGAALSAALDFEAVLDRLLEQMARVVRYDTTNIMVVDKERQRARIARMRGYEQFGEAVVRDTAALTFDIASTPNLRRMAETGQPLIIPDTHADPGWIRVKASEFIRSWAGAPVRAQGEVVAFFSVGKTRPNFYQPEDAARLAIFAGQAALALHNALLFGVERRRADELDVLHAVAAASADAADEDVLIERITEVLSQKLFSDNCGVLLMDEAAGLLRGHPSYHAPAAVRASRPTVPLGGGIVGKVALDGRPRRIPDVSAVPEFLADDPRSRSELCVPLKIGERVLGVINVESVLPNRFSESDEQLLLTIAGQLTTALENIRLFSATADALAREKRLNEMARTLNSVLDLPTVLQYVVRLAAELVGAEAAALGLVASDRESVEYPYLFNLPGPLALQPAPRGQGLAWRIVETGESMLMENYGAHPQALPDWVAAGVRAFMGVPVVVGEQRLGALGLFGLNVQAHFTRRDLALAESVGRQAGAAIQNARLFAETQRRFREQAMLYDCSRALALVPNASAAIAAVAQRMVDWLGATALCYYTYDEAAQTVRTDYEYWTPQASPRERQSVLGQTWPLADYPRLAAVLRTRQPQVIRRSDPGLTPAERDMFGEWGGQTVIAVPMAVQDRVLAYFEIWDSRAERDYDQAEIRLLLALADQVALAVERARLFEAEHRRAEEQRLLYQAARSFTAGLSQEAVLQAVARQMVDALEIATCTVSLWEPESDELVTLLDYSPLPDEDLDQPGARYALSDYPATRRVLESRQPLLVRADDPDADPVERALLREFECQAALMLALVAGDKVFGLIELYQSAGAAPFSKADLQLAQALAAQAAVALENVRLHTAVQDRVRELDALLTANAAMLSTLELEPLLKNVLQAAIAAIPAAEKGAILLVDPPTGQLQMRAVAGYTDPRIQTFAFAGSGGYSAKALREARPLLIRDARSDPEIAYEGDIPEARDILSAVAAPLMMHGEPQGVISLDATRRAAFTPADLRLLEAFANTAAVVIDHARLHAEVRALAVTDGLTSLTNHRAFVRALEIEIARAGRYGYPVGLVFLDIDSFKQYNDTYGHLAGNERLKAIATLLRERVREPDLAARYGGEEFAILLPHTTKEGALVLAERIRAAAEAAAPPPRAPGAPISGFTLSLGVSVFPYDAATPEALLKAADDAEIAAKRAGKNRVCAAP